MLCDACKKNEATVHLTQIVENKMQTIDLCEGCSKSKGVDDPTGFSLAGLLMGLGNNPEAETAAPGIEVKCERCGFSLADFKKSGRLGCAECYVTFAEPLHGLLKSMHKGVKHTGKVPRELRQTQDISEKLQVLQTQLDQAVKAENFEQAAVLRDRIKQLREHVEAK